MSSKTFKSIRFAKKDPNHDKAGPFSTDDEEHYAVSTQEYEQQVKHVKKRSMQEDIQEEIKKGDFVKDTVHGHVHRVFAVSDNNLSVGRYHGKNSYGGTTNLHVSKAKKVEKPVNEELVVEGTPARIRLQKAMERARQASEASRKRAEEMLKPKEKPAQPVKEELVVEGKMGEKAAGDLDFHPEVKKDKPPFDGPYKRTSGNVTDKSGAVHTPMSRVHHLARQAMKGAQQKQVGTLAKKSLSPIKESRKVEIIKGAADSAKKKKSDKFEPDPTLESQVQKIDNT